MSKPKLNENLDSFTRDVFEDPDLQFEVSEASGEVDGQHVIGRVRGTFFVPNGVSRNNRFYSKDLWESVLADPEVQEKLKNKRMLGTVGHDLPIDDKAVRDGMISHIVTKLEIGESAGKYRGMGEALILDTPAGRSLNVLLHAGSKLFTSSRAFGKFSGNENGVPKVDKGSYKLTGFDMVLDPGFVEANPKLVEQLEINNINSNKKGEIEMSTELLEKVVKQNTDLQRDLSKALDENDDWKTKFETAIKEVEDLKKANADLAAKGKEASEKLATSESNLGFYNKLGSVKEIEEALKGQKELVAKYAEIGTPEKITEAFTKLTEMLNQYKALGTPKELDKAIEESVKTIKAYKELGTPAALSKKLEEASALVEKYKAFGSVEDLEKVFEKMKTIASNMKSESLNKKVGELAKELRVTDEAVRKLLEKGLSDEDIRLVLKNVSESVTVANKYRKQELTENKDAKNPVTEEHKNPMQMSRADRLMSSFGGK